MANQPAKVVSLGESPFQLTNELLEFISKQPGTTFDLSLSGLKIDIYQTQS